MHARCPCSLTRAGPSSSSGSAGAATPTGPTAIWKGWLWRQPFICQLSVLQILGNQFNGTGMVESAATGWINVKGNDWTVEDNTGADSVKNGYQVHQVYPGWGIGNVFTGNRAQVNGPGYGIYVQSKRLQTVVACNNVVSAAGSGFSTIACSPA
jgi:hypothetical protein